MRLFLRSDKSTSHSFVSGWDKCCSVEAQMSIVSLCDSKVADVWGFQDRFIIMLCDIVLPAS